MLYNMPFKFILNGVMDIDDTATGIRFQGLNAMKLCELISRGEEHQIDFNSYQKAET